VTIGTFTHVIASAKLPEDLVYKITKTLVDNRDQLAVVVSAIKGTTPKEMAEDVGVPFHPGAKRYFDQVARQ
jgi:uncharacterized protein